MHACSWLLNLTLACLHIYFFHVRSKDYVVLKHNLFSIAVLQESQTSASFYSGDGMSKPRLRYNLWVVVGVIFIKHTALH